MSYETDAKLFYTVEMFIIKIEAVDYIQIIISMYARLILYIIIGSGFMLLFIMLLIIFKLRQLSLFY